MNAPISVTLLVLAQVACAPPPVAQQEPGEGPLEPMLLAAFQAVNPEIGEAAVLELRAIFPGGPYVLIGWGIRSDRQFRGNFNDELFGVFVVDPSWRRIERTLEILPTPRWLDYELHIESLTPIDVIVVGQGRTYGDSPIRRTHALVGSPIGR